MFLVKALNKFPRSPHSATVCEFQKAGPLV